MKKEKEIHQSLCKTIPESAKVTYIVHDETMQKKKVRNLWIYYVMACLKK